MQKDIIYLFNKERENKCGNRGYLQWKNDKHVSIRPRLYGEFLVEHKRRRK